MAQVWQIGLLLLFVLWINLCYQSAVSRKDKSTVRINRKIQSKFLFDWATTLFIPNPFSFDKENIKEMELWLFISHWIYLVFTACYYRPKLQQSSQILCVWILCHTFSMAEIAILKLTLVKNKCSCSPENINSFWWSLYNIVNKFDSTLAECCVIAAWAFLSGISFMLADFNAFFPLLGRIDFPLSVNICFASV